MIETKSRYDVVVVGGGFYGCIVALNACLHFKKILIIEKDDDLLLRASYANQARVHNGYHYPRSRLTAIRSRINFPRFIKDFKSAIYKDFEKVYAISKNGSKINSNQFYKFCQDIGSPIKQAPESIKKLFNSVQIEDVFTVKEFVFDAIKLKHFIIHKLIKSKIDIKYNSEVKKISGMGSERLTVHTNGGKTVFSKMVFNCTYSQINTLLKNSDLPTIPLKHEVTEMALIKVPDKFQKMGITVMDGPFFSIMPFPPRKLHTISHVRFTPHCSWLDKHQFQNPHQTLNKLKLKTNYPYMIRDAGRYIPGIERCNYVDSIYEIKTLLPRNEVDDGRPILFKKDYGLKNFHIIMGGKIDNIYDILESIEERNVWD